MSKLPLEHLHCKSIHIRNFIYPCSLYSLVSPRQMWDISLSDLNLTENSVLPNWIRGLLYRRLRGSCCTPPHHLIQYTQHSDRHTLHWISHGEERRRWGYGKPLATHPNFCWGRAHLCFIAVPFYLGSVCEQIGRLGVKSFTRQRKSRGRGQNYMAAPHPHFWSQIDGRGLKMEETGRFHKTWKVKIIHHWLYYARSQIS